MIDAVVIATPTSTHAQVIKDASAAGKTSLLKSRLAA